MQTYIDKARAQRIIDFIQTLTIPEGMHQGKPFILRPWQQEIIMDVYSPVDENGLRVVRKAILSMGKKNGKGLALNTPLPTPTGWMTMDDVKPGDILYDEFGNECKVTFESDIKNIDCYSVSFSNNDTVICDEEHLWVTSTILSNKKTRSMKEIYLTQSHEHSIESYETVKIISVKKTPSVPTKCIRVDSPNSLFLCGKTMIPTHNTPLIAAIVLTHLIGPEAKRNEQMNSAAFEREQAGIVFKYMENIIYADEELKEATIIRTTKKEIEGRYTGSIYKALSAETKSKHGFSPALLAFDELAQFGADRRFYDTLVQGFGAHLEPMLWIISTQAADDLAVLSEEIDYVIKNGHTDPTVKLFLFTSPIHDEKGEEIDIMDRESWKLSNPALDDFLSLKDMVSLANTAHNMPSSEPGFRNLRLNQRISTDSPFMSIGVWTKNNALPSVDALSKGRITAGLDLSGKNDLSALVLDAFYYEEIEIKVAGNLSVIEKGKKGFHNLFAYFWKPGDLIQEHKKKDRVPYDLWVKQGHIEAKPGKTIDYEYIALKVYELHVLHHIDELRFDRWRIEDFQRALDKVGCDTYIKDKEESPGSDALCLVPHGQGFKDINPAIESVEDVFTDSRARHGGNPVLTNCVANTVVTFDPANNRKFEKQKSTGRIDGTVAMAMAMNGAELPQLEDTTQPAVIFI